jgi:hypothetical protein
MELDMKEIGYWLRYNFATEWGGHCVPEWTIVTIEEYIDKQVAVYGEHMRESINEDRKDEEYSKVTHIARCLTGAPIELVDGTDVWLDLSGDTIELCRDLDVDYQGGEYEEAQKWLRNLAEPIDA